MKIFFHINVTTYLIALNLHMLFELHNKFFQIFDFCGKYEVLMVMILWQDFSEHDTK